jgi:hypothetical protein
LGKFSGGEIFGDRKGLKKIFLFPRLLSSRKILKDCTLEMLASRRASFAYKRFAARVCGQILAEQFGSFNVKVL